MMLKHSRAWVVPATALLLFAPVAARSQEHAETSVQDVADLVSQTHYETYHLAVENMGLGLYGGADYNMGYRNRDGWDDPGSPTDNDRAGKRGADETSVAV